MTTERKQSLRIFSPVILFHDHEYTKDDSTEHIHIASGDPFHQSGRTIERHKRRVSQMLENNGRLWSDIITWSRDHALTASAAADHHSPVPSLVSSPTPPLESQDLPSPRQSPPSQPRRHSTNKSTSTTATAGSVVVSTTATTTTPNGKPNKRRRGNLPKAVTDHLKRYLVEHKKHPYPTEEEKSVLARHTGLTMNQISNWFINARRRILQPMLEQQQEQDELGILPYENPHHHQYHSSSPSSSSDDSLDRRLRKRPASEAFHRRNSTSQKKITRRRRS